jgi:acyl transferase domain-containing protein/D-arabinose 1-dehydrogenase-like Zn-dependent alcohol dehydrogenase/acyl carrier protein
MGSPTAEILDQKQAVAVIGMQLRYPGASTVHDFWENLRNGVETISFFTEEELLAAGLPPETIRHPSFVNANPHIGDITGFEPAFFGFTPREAEVIDPQVRVLLETSWQALEDAGYDPERYRGRIGVFTGANLSRYFMHNLLHQSAQLTAGLGSISAISMFNDRDALATIVSYKLNLRGPGVTVQTYCSTSLVAVHLACQSILLGDSDMVVAGGVSLNGEATAGYHYEEGSIVSRDGHCRTFDAQASGTVFGNGCGMVVLKRLDRAIADGDTIHAVIRGSAINNDGAVKAGFLAPSVQGQVESITAALERSGVHPDSIGFVEAHGTATLVGDPIEVSALSKAFSLWTEQRQYCVLGSVKANFGHLDRAAGVAGLMKTVLAVKEGVIPPTVNYSVPNPKIDFAHSPFYVTTKLAPWRSDGQPRRALVASLGVGGTNAHAVIEQPPAAPATGPSRAAQLFVLSARIPESLEAMTEGLLRHLQHHPSLPLADAAFTLAVGRKGFAHRRAVVGHDAVEIARALAADKSATTPAATKRPVAFLFPGQGAQHVAMGRGLYDTEAVFREEVDAACALLRPHLGLDLRDVLYPEPTLAAEAAAGEKLRRTSLTQPALFVIEYALARLWLSWGIRPDAMIGHSIGEYVAATVAGVFAVEDALALVAARGRLMQALPAGAMLAVPLPEAEIGPLLGTTLSLAAVNSPASCVVSGPTADIASLERALAARGVGSRPLQTSHAFHSAMMDPILAEFTALVGQVARHAPKVPYVSNLTGKWIEPAQAASPEYWARHLRGAVRFSDGAGLLLASGTRTALEVGPGRTLSSLAWQRPDVSAHGTPVTSMRHPREGISDSSMILGALGRLWVAGVEVDWEGYYAGERRRRIPLPKYVFTRQRYWVNAPSVQAAAAAGGAAQWTRRADVADWFYAPRWTEAPLAPAPAVARTWLLLADPGPARDALEARLRAEGQEPVIAESGPAFAKLGAGRYRLNPGAKDDYAALLDALREEGKFPHRIAHLWAAAAAPGDALEHFAATQDRCFYSLLFLAQALGRQNLAEALHLGVVTRGLQSLAGEAVAAPERATLIGPCKVIAQEFPEVFSTAIDVAGTEDEAAAAIVAELTGAPKDPVVAWRRATRSVQRFESQRIEGAPGAPALLQTGGTYLITGGLGGIGLKVAEWLARTAKARLVLVNRSALPPRAEWAAAGDDRLGRRVRAVEALEKLGAEVLVVKADSGDLGQMRAAVAEAQARFGRIDGVMHAAGVAGDGVIQLKEKAVAAAVIDAKVRAALILAEVLRSAPPAFTVHFSSLAAVVGGFGQVDYCGANSGLDALAQAAQAAGGPPVISINWDAWAEVGMAVETAVRPKLAQLFKQASQFQMIEHPIFNRVRTDGDEIHYVAELQAENSWLVSDHVLFGKPTLPGTAYLDLARSAFARHADASTYTISDVFILALFIVEPGQSRDVHVFLTKAGDGYDFAIKSPAPHDPENWLEHCRGHIAPGVARPPGSHDFAAIVARCNESFQEVYASTHATPGVIVQQAVHMGAGPRWMTPEWVRMGIDEGCSEQRLGEAYVGDLRDHPLHPGLLDITSFYPIRPKGHGVYVPFSHRVVHVYAPMPPRTRAHVVVTDDGKVVRLDVFILDDAGREVVVMEDYLLKQIETREQKPESAAATEYFPFLPGAGNFQVNMGALGQLDTLALVASERRAPAAGEIEIQVCAAGLNFKDVLRGLGMLSAEHDAGLAIGFGGECAGQVVAVGPGVADFLPGDRVIAMGSKCFGGFLTTSALAAAPLAEGLSYVEGATIPTVFLTAHYALHHQARLQKGEKVLIHAAAGGVGLAAVQCARRVGAEVYATAGSPAKRDYLKSLGIEHVFDSRSLSFAADVMQATGGQGVDVLLNSLAGEFILKGLEVLAPFGRFVEIGARDIYQNSQIGLRPFAKNLSLIAIELSPLMVTRPQFVREMLDEITGYFRAGSFRPLPTEVFPITEVADAFQRMASAKHIGKVVLSIAPPARPVLTGGRRGGRSAAVAVEAAAAARGGAHEAAIAPAEGVEALSRIMAAGAAQVAVSSRPLQPIIDFLRGQKETEPAAGAAEPAARKLYPRPALVNAYTPPTTETEKALAQIWQDLIGIEQVGAQDNFFELGGDSLIGVQVISRIKRAFSVQLASTALYEGPTLDAFARAIDAARGEAAPVAAAKEAGA